MAMQVRGHLAEVTFDALAADLTVPQPRPLVDLERDEYADLEVDDEPYTTRFEPVTAPFEQVASPPPPAPTRWWRGAQVIAAVATTALGFGLGAGIASLLI